MAHKDKDEKTKKGGQGTVVLRCTCVHAFQDKEYGTGMRLHNNTAKGARCTVCKRETN